MAVTNLLAFTAYCPDATIAGVVLDGKGINPYGSDQIEVSSAWGMLEKVKGSDYAQGRTQETLSLSSKKMLIDDAKRIFKQFNVVYIEYQTANITGVQW